MDHVRLQLDHDGKEREGYNKMCILLLTYTVYELVGKEMALYN
jgi:hypothetical protein